MRDPKFRKNEDFIDMVIAKGFVTEDDEDALWHKTDDVSCAECRSYLAARLEEKKRIDEENAREEAEFENRRKSASSSKKQGNMKICPNCGATVQGGNAKCPECGFAFMDVDAVSSAQELDRRLRKIVGTSDDCDKQRAAIISSFPIPNTREDLLEFLSAMEPKAFHGEASDLKQAYFSKFNECLNKAKISFPDDPALKVFENNSQKRKKRRIIIWGTILAVLVIIIGYFVGSHMYISSQYDEWERNAYKEIEAYSSELNQKLKEIPMPTENNWEECGHMLNSITWDKIWKPDQKFSSVADHYVMIDGLDKDSFEAFAEKKNNIAESIIQARMAARKDGDYYTNPWFTDPDR